MRRNKDRTDADGMSAPRSRGWGPFSGGQLTLIIVTVVVMVGLPVGAFAVVKGSNSFITDATSGTHAKVTSNGQLQTHPNGPLTVSGSVTPAAPASMIVDSLDGGLVPSLDYQPLLLETLSAGKAVVVTSITIGPHGVLNSTASVEIKVGSTPALSYAIGVVTLNPGTQPVTLPFPSGLPIKHDHQLWLFGRGPSIYADASVNGYYVPAAQCSATTCY